MPPTAVVVPMLAPAERREVGRVGLDPEGDPEIGRLRPTGVVGDGVDEVVGRLESEVERGDIPVYEEGLERVVVAWLLVGTGGGISGL